MRVLDQAEVRKLLDLDELVEALSTAMIDLSSGRVSMPPRVAARVEKHDAFLGAMPAYVPSLNGLAAKLVAVFPHNSSEPTHQAVVVAFDPATGTPLALMDGAYITAVRTAAGSALATRLLAREDAHVLTILGTGVQARSHARAILRDRAITEVRVAGRRRQKAEELAEELAGESSVKVSVVEAWKAAMDGADIVCATTHATEPIILQEFIQPGMHINSVGFSGGYEVSPELFGMVNCYVEHRDSATAPPPAGSAELVAALNEGFVARQALAEVGEVLTGTRQGRTNPDEVTLYKSVGVAAQDAAAASLVLSALESQAR